MFHRTLVIAAVLLSPCASAQTIVLRAGHLIDPATGSVVDNTTVVVKGTKVEAVGKNLPASADAQVVDLSHSWVMPGLMDAHTHLTFDFEETTSLQAPQLHEGTGMRSLRGLHNADLVLRAGFTTVRDVGNDANFAAVDLRRAIDRGWFVGPTILTAGKIIAPFGGQSVGIPPEQGPLWHFEYFDADGPDEIRRAVRQDIYYGADLIKLVADNSDYHYTEEEVRAAVAEAHRAGRAVAVHVFTDEPARDAIRGGADSIEHGFWLSDAVLKLMKEKGTVLVGTDFPESLLEVIEARHQLGDAKQTSADIIDRLQRAYRLGVTMVFGTDVVVNLPQKDRAQTMLEYPSVWAKAGIPPKDILKGMTTNAAALLRVQKVRGAIAPEQAADIIAMPQNPLEDIAALRTIHFVMKNGKIVRQP